MRTMRKTWFLAVIVSLLFMQTAFAGVYRMADAKISSDIVITINGEIVPFKAAIIEGKSYLPVNVIGYALNSTVEWNSYNRTIYLQTQEERLPYQQFMHQISPGKNKKALFVDNMRLYLNQEYYDQLSRYLAVIDGRSYLPIRDIAEMIGIRATWDAENRTIHIVNPRIATISAEDLPYYVKALPKIEKQEDYLIGNWRGEDTASMDGTDYRTVATFYISRNSDETYTVIKRVAFNDAYDTQYNGMGYVVKYSSAVWNEREKTLRLRREDGVFLSDDFGGGWKAANILFHLDGDVLTGDYRELGGSGGDYPIARYERF